MIMNQYDVGIQQDFDNMTLDISHLITIYKRINFLNSEGQESYQDDPDGLVNDPQYDSGTEEYAYVQELDTQHEMVQSGQLDVGDVRIVFPSTSTVTPECIVVDNNIQYKIITYTKTSGMNNQIVMSIVAHGKRLPGR